jgi:precorrin-6Y C5,15-methyltransferase (decarboxylating)
VVSLHGRSARHLPGLLLAHPKTFVFTDKTNSPDSIARLILAYLALIGAREIRKNCLLHVAEDLGSGREKIRSGSLDEIAERHFSDLNVLCIVLPKAPCRPGFGLSEDDISHSRGLITKDEIRAATLHRLRLPRTGVFWDIGGGSGSISVEAAAMHPRLTVYTVEHKDEELDNIKENIRRFGLFNIIPVAGRAADVIAGLPDPDAVFVGGSGGELERIITQSAARLSAVGRLVVNGVMEKTRVEAPRLMEAQGMTVESSRITLHREGPDGPLAFNPITIMVGKK